MELIEYRKQELSEEQGNVLMQMFEQHYRLETVDRKIPLKDEEGRIYGWEHDFEKVGYSVRGGAPTKLVEAVQRPASIQHIAAHLTRLSAHKRWSKGSAFEHFLEDAMRALAGVSEFAVVKACDEFHKQRNPFYPDTGELIQAVLRWDEWVNPRPKKEKPKKEEFVSNLTQKEKRQGMKMVKLSLKGAKTRREQQYIDTWQRVRGKK